MKSKLKDVEGKSGSQGIPKETCKIQQINYIIFTEISSILLTILATFQSLYRSNKYSVLKIDFKDSDSFAACT